MKKLRCGAFLAIGAALEAATVRSSLGSVFLHEYVAAYLVLTVAAAEVSGTSVLYSRRNFG